MIPLRLRRQVSSYTHRQRSRHELSYSSGVHEVGRAKGGETGGESEGNRQTVRETADFKAGRVSMRFRKARRSSTRMMISRTTSGSIRERSSSPLRSRQQTTLSLL